MKIMMMRIQREIATDVRAERSEMRQQIHIFFQKTETA